MARILWNRRDAVKAGLATAMLPRTLFASGGKMIRKPIPSSGEPLPVIGLGTWQVFDIGSDDDELAVRADIIDALTEHGGSVIDSSPMYARAEKIVGDVLRSRGNRDDLFLATKVWTNGRDSGISQMDRSIDLMAAQKIDLMQVHNLRDVAVHMATIREWQQDGKIRYSGVTDYRASALDELEAAMRRYKPEFIQINYSLGERAAERRVLPLAQELGMAVLINRPFVSGQLFREIRSMPIPDWARPFAASWGQFFLKFIVSHPAVTCAIPATSKLQHMIDNAGAGAGEMPDNATRQRMAAFFDSL